MDSGWRTDIHPGYRTKVIRVGNATVEINRPILDANEQVRRENQVKDALRLFGKAMLANEERSANYEHQ